MIVYQGTSSLFRRDVVTGLISSKIDHLFEELGIPRENYAEYTSWRNSLPRMANILTDSRISDEAEVAEQTVTREYIVSGPQDIDSDSSGTIVDLQQFEAALPRRAES